MGVLTFASCVPVVCALVSHPTLFTHRTRRLSRSISAKAPPPIKSQFFVPLGTPANYTDVMETAYEAVARLELACCLARSALLLAAHSTMLLQAAKLGDCSQVPGALLPHVPSNVTAA